MQRRVRFTAYLVSALALVLMAPPASAQVCEDISDECRTTRLADCTDAVGESVTVQIGGPGAEDSDANGGTCAGDPATALLTFTKTSATELELSMANTSCVDSTLTAAYWNMTTTVTSLALSSTTAVSPDAVDTTWTSAYSQTDGNNDGFGFRADGFGNFDANVHNGNLTPNGGNPTEVLDGETLIHTFSLAPGFNLCDILSTLSTPPPGDRNRNAVGRFQSCGVDGNSAYIGPCTADESLLAVISDIRLNPSDRRVQVEWDTSLEIDNAGFNVLRREKLGGGPWSFVNVDFIPGAGDSVSGASYQMVDLSALNGVEYDYRIEDIDFQGKNGLSDIHKTVANPPTPDVQLLSPEYGALVALQGLVLGYDSTSSLRGGGRLQVSSSPDFSDFISANVSVRAGTREVRLNPHTLSQIGNLAAASEGVVYWRLADKRSNPVSDTFRLEVE